MILSLPRGWWGYHWSPPRPRSVVELIRAGTLDAELASLLWLLLEGRVPIVVAARPPLAGKSTTLTALLDFLPSGTRPIVLSGWSETFSWLPEAAELGWTTLASRNAGFPDRMLARLSDSAGGPAAVPAIDEFADPSSCYLLASELSNHLPIYTWGAQARVAIRATSLGYGLGSTIHADSLGEVLGQLSAPPVALGPDETRSLGVVLILRMFRPDGSLLDPEHGSREVEMAPLDRGVRRRVVAAHYVRPLERDAGGHLQRRPPAVLATWNPETDSLEHFGWGIAAELAARVGRSPAEFEREQRARAEFLAGLAGEGIADLAGVSGAIETYRVAAATRAARIAATPRPPNAGPAGRPLTPAGGPPSMLPGDARPGPFSMPPEPS